MWAPLCAYIHIIHTQTITILKLQESQIEVTNEQTHTVT